MTLTGIALTVLAGLTFGPLVLHGGFHFDDWSNGAKSLYPPPGSSAFSQLADVALFRPVLILYVPLTYFVFGMHMWLHLAWSVALGVAVSLLLYVVLRELGVPRLHRGFVAALILLFPWFDGIRYWVTGAQVSLSISIMLIGLVVALYGLDRASWRWHCGAALIYLVSILTYEITLPLIAALGVIYVCRIGWREGRIRWGMDLIAAAIGGIWVASHTERTTAGLSGDISHLGEIINGGAEILGRTAVPLGGPHTTLALVILASILSAGLATLMATPRQKQREPRWELRGWLLLAGAGLAIAILGWVIFIPADPYYTPVIWGVTNRVNGLSGIGLVMLVYASLGVFGELVVRAWGRTNATVVVVSSCLALLIAGSYVSVIRRHTGIWNAAYVAEETAIDRIEERYPQLPSGTTLLVSGYPAWQTLGVPILSATWDVTGMVQDRYQDGSLAAYPVLEGLAVDCRPEGVGLAGAGAPETSASYGTVLLLDLTRGESARPLNRRECLQVAGDYQPGPFYLSYDY